MSLAKPAPHRHAPCSDGLFWSSGLNSGLYGLKRTRGFARDNCALKSLVLCCGLVGYGAVRGVLEAGAQQGAVGQLKPGAALWQPGFAISACFALPPGASSSFSAPNKAVV